ncbi:MAG: hemolysin III family protein [Pseudomonadota bacterium]
MAETHLHTGTYTPMPYPRYSREERVADFSMHVAGVLGGLVASILLIRFVALQGDANATFSTLVYCFAVMFSFVVSAAYHFTPVEAYRHFFQRWDHAAIFLKIAGTYTAMVMIIGGDFSFFVLGIVWALSIGGMIWKVAYWTEPNWRSTLLYLALGWGAIVLAYPLIATLPWASSAFVGVGALVYTLGTFFYSAEHLRFSMAIWHLCVLLATASFMVAIWIARGGAGFF